ncbi:MAG: gamma-butyrobetaine hydroxylase-like domain-containing protein [Ignavibacteria bacterium]
MVPKQIKIKKENLFIKWDDESESLINLKYIRDECPCASCKGETILLKTYKPVKPSSAAPEMYLIKDIQTVGGYAIQITWKDNHNTGIYTWEYLRKLDEEQSGGIKQNYSSLL